MECQVLSRWEEFGVRPEDLPSRVDFQSHDWIFNWQQLASRDLRGRLFLGQDPYKRFKWTQSDRHSCPKGLLYVAASWGIFWTDSKTLSTNHLHFKTRRIDQHRIRVKNIETLHVPDTETPFSLLQDTVPSAWYWSCYFKFKKLHNVALSMSIWLCCWVEIFPSNSESNWDRSCCRRAEEEPGMIPRACVCVCVRATACVCVQLAHWTLMCWVRCMQLQRG